MRRTFVILSFVLVAGICRAEDRPLTVGVIAPTTGPTGSYGIAVANGIRLAQEDTGDHSTRYNFESVEYDAKQAVTAFKKLVDSDKVDIVYVWGVAFCVALAPMAEAEKKLLVAECIHDEVDKGRDHVFRLMTASPRYMQVQRKYLAEKKIKSIKVVVAENTYLEEMLRALQAELGPEIALSVERFPPTANDFRSTIAALRNHPVDAVGVFLTAGQIGTFYRQLAALQLQKLPTFGTNFFDSESERKAADGTMDGAIYVTDHVPPVFTERFKAATGSLDDINFGYFAYRFATIVSALGKKGGSREISKEEFLRAGSEAVGSLDFPEDTFDVMRVAGDKAIVEKAAVH